MEASKDVCGIFRTCLSEIGGKVVGWNWDEGDLGRMNGKMKREERKRSPLTSEVNDRDSQAVKLGGKSQFTFDPKVSCNCPRVLKLELLGDNLGWI